MFQTLCSFTVVALSGKNGFDFRRIAKNDVDIDMKTLSHHINYIS